MKEIIVCFFICFIGFTAQAKINFFHQYFSYDTLLRPIKYTNTWYCRGYIAVPEPACIRVEIGYMPNKKHDIGVGAGIDLYAGFYRRLGGNLGGIYCKYNYYFLNKRNSPFLSASLGYAWAIGKRSDDIYSKFDTGYIKRAGGMNSQIGVGYKIRARYTRFAMSIGLYYNYQHYKYYEYRSSANLYDGRPPGSTPLRTVRELDIVSDSHNVVLGISIGLK